LKQAENSLLFHEKFVTFPFPALTGTPLGIIMKEAFRRLRRILFHV